MSDDNLFTRTEIRRGISGGRIKRATMLVSLIERQTAHLKLQAINPLGFIMTESTQGLRTHAYFEALSIHDTERPDIDAHDIERYAGDWALILPESPSIKATVAYILGERYKLLYDAVPATRKALGLDTDDVQKEYAVRYEADIAEIYTQESNFGDRLRWATTSVFRWIDALPVFWTAFVISMVIGGVTFAVPIAAAGIGAIPTIVLIVVIGLINMLTVAAMGEIVTRSSSLRYGTAIYGGIVRDFLGGFSSTVLSLMLSAFSFGLLLIFYLGLSSTLEGATTIPAEIWMVVVFLVAVYFLTRGSLNGTVAITILLAAANLTLMLVLIGLAFTHWKLDNFLYVNIPFVEGSTFNIRALSVVTGILLDIYAAHMMVTIFARPILNRDPSGRSIMRGLMSGIGAGMVLNSLWVVAVNGAVSPERLASETGTALVPLIEQVGPAVGVIGAVFALTSMGLASIHFSLALFNLVRERLGTRQTERLGSLGTFMVSLSPVAITLLLAEILWITESGSFAGILGFLGVVVDSLVGGIFPALLLVSIRRKGEIIPAVLWRALGSPILMTVIYSLFLINIIVHGLFIWDGPAERIGGLGIAAIVIVLTVRAIRAGAWQPRTVIEFMYDLRDEPTAYLNVVHAGEMMASSQTMKPSEAAGSHTLPTAGAGEVKVWSHQHEPEGHYVHVPLAVSYMAGAEKEEVAVPDQAVIRFDAPVDAVTIEIPELTGK